MPDIKAHYDPPPPIPSYEEATAGSTSGRAASDNEPWTPAGDDDDDNREGRSLLNNDPVNTTTNRPGRHRSEGYRPPTVETDDEDSLFSSDSDSDSDETAHVRREMQEMEIEDAEHDDNSSNFSTLLRKRMGISLPKWRWSWRWSLPQLRMRDIRLGQEESRNTGPSGDGEPSEPAPSRWRRWALPIALPAVNSTAMLIVVGRLLAIMVVLGFVYLLFMSDLFAGIGRRMGSQMFDPESVRIHVQSQVDPLRIRENLRQFTKYPHIAGTEGDYALALDMKNEFVKYGLEDISVEQYYVYLNYPTKEGRSVRIIPEGNKPGYTAQLEEQNVNGPSAGHQTYVFHGHSKSGEVSGPLIYGGFGTRQDFKQLHDSGIDTKGAIALVRSRGQEDNGALKVKAAEMAGFVGCLIYIDPSDFNFTGKGEQNGDNASWLPYDGVMRQAVSLTNWIIGDPLTPGWESTKDMPRLPRKEAEALPKIPSLPLSWFDARHFLLLIQGIGQKVDLQGSSVNAGDKEWWTGNLSSPIIHLKNEQDEEDKKAIWNVYGRITGVEQSSKSIIIGNHRDAWTLGAIDPGSGTAVFLEMARIFGDLLRRGWRPLRTIEFMSWDAEEYNLAGSTEFVEKNLDGLRDDAMAYINLDAAVTGSSFKAMGSPVFRKLLLQILGRVSDPNFNTTIRDVWTQQKNDIENLGWESDYLAFQDIAGTSSLDLAFEGGASPAFSAYDNFAWMETLGDPGFVYHTLLGQILGLLILELADRPVMPFDMDAYAQRIGGWIDDLVKWSENKGLNQAGTTPVSLDVLKEAGAEISQAVAHFEKWEVEWENRVVKASGWESNGLGGQRDNYNIRMAHFDTKLLDLAEQGGGVRLSSLFHEIIITNIRQSDPQPHPIQTRRLRPSPLARRQLPLFPSHLRHHPGPELDASQRDDRQGRADYEGCCKDAERVGADG